MLLAIMGRGASGKDTLYSSILKNSKLGSRFSPLVLYTTRPMREGEIPDVTYHFVDKKIMEELDQDNLIFEKRVYNVKYNGAFCDWWYFTCVKGVDAVNNDIVVICTPDVFEKFCQYYGSENVLGVYLSASRQTRENRMTLRELQQPKEKQNFEELKRRLDADDAVYLFDELPYKPNVITISADYCEPSVICEAVCDAVVENILEVLN